MNVRITILGLALLSCAGNHSPAITSIPATEVAVYDDFAYEIVCSDDDGDRLTLAQASNLDLSGEALCAGTLVDNGDGTGTFAFTPELEMAGTACVIAITCNDGDATVTQESVLTIEVPTDILELTFGELEPWATPISDYIAEATEGLGHDAFNKGVSELAVFDERLYFGYGDATYNAGQATDIEIRAFTAPEPSASLAEYVTEDEEVSRMRVDGDMLFVPGLDDKTEYDDEGNVVLSGNAYSLMSGGSWVMTSSLSWGWHVHDMVRLGDTIYAGGSGGTLDDYDASAVEAILWRSDDGGATFVVDTEIAHPSPPGDQRFLNLVAIGDVLYAFGYVSVEEGAYAMGYRQDADGLELWDDMPNFFPFDRVTISADMALLTGVDIASMTWAGRLLTSDGTANASGLDGITVIDAEPLSDERTLLLYVDGDTYPLEEQYPWQFHVGVVTLGASRIEILSGESDSVPLSVAFWRRSIYVGMDDGALWRADGSE